MPCPHRGRTAPEAGRGEDPDGPGVPPGPPHPTSRPLCPVPIDKPGVSPSHALVPLVRTVSNSAFPRLNAGPLRPGLGPSLRFPCLCRWEIKMAALSLGFRAGPGSSPFCAPPLPLSPLSWREGPHSALPLSTTCPYQQRRRGRPSGRLWPAPRVGPASEGHKLRRLLWPIRLRVLLLPTIPGSAAWPTNAKVPETQAGGKKGRFIQNASLLGRWQTPASEAIFPICRTARRSDRPVRRGSTKGRAS